MRYAIVVHKDPQSAYGVTAPDLPGCFSGGDTLEEACNHAQEAILCHLEGLLLDGETLPEPRPLEEHQANEDYRDGVYWRYVDVDLAAIRSDKAKAGSKQ